MTFVQDMVVSCGWEKKLFVDAVDSSEVIHSETSEFAFGRCSMHPSNTMFAVGAYKVTPADQDRVLIYHIDATGASIEHSLSVFGRNPFSLQFSRNGQYLAATCTTGLCPSHHRPCSIDWQDASRWSRPSRGRW